MSSKVVSNLCFIILRIFIVFFSLNYKFHKSLSSQNGADFLLSQDGINSLRANKPHMTQSSSSYNKIFFFKFLTLKTENQVPGEGLNYQSDKISHAPTNDFLTSLDITREVKLPKENESILKEKSEQTCQTILNNSSKNFTVSNGVNTLLSKHSSITFASVFKNQSLSLAHSTENNNSMNTTTHNTSVTTATTTNYTSNEKR